MVTRIGEVRLEEFTSQTLSTSKPDSEFILRPMLQLPSDVKAAQRADDLDRANYEHGRGL